MEKTLVIDGKEVTFKGTGGLPIRYKAQFGKDYFSEIAKMGSGKKVDAGQIDMEVFYNLAYVMAKTADKSIPSPLEWFDSFDSFPIMEIMPEIQEILLHVMQTTKKK